MSIIDKRDSTWVSYWPWSASLTDRIMVMPTFRILPAQLDEKLGWIVQTTHDNGVVETSIVFESQEKAQIAVVDWTHLDEDWEKV